MDILLKKACPQSGTANEPASGVDERHIQIYGSGKKV
jgi:hypothetical protein